MSAGQFGKPSRYAINATDGWNYPNFVSYSDAAVAAHVCVYHLWRCMLNICCRCGVIAVLLAPMERGFQVICMNPFAFFYIACGGAYAKTVLDYAFAGTYVAKSLLMTGLRVNSDVVCGIYPYKAHERASL